MTLQQEKVTLADDSIQLALSSEVQELQKAHKEITEEIQSLQQKLLVVAEKLATKEPELQRLNDERREREEAVESRLSELRSREANLTPCADGVDHAIVTSVDSQRQQALDALLLILR